MTKYTVESHRRNIKANQTEFSQMMIVKMREMGFKDYNITRESLSNKENGKTEFTWSEIKAIASICGVSVDAIA